MPSKGSTLPLDVTPDVLDATRSLRPQAARKRIMLQHLLPLSQRLKPSSGPAPGTISAVEDIAGGGTSFPVAPDAAAFRPPSPSAERKPSAHDRPDEDKAASEGGHAPAVNFSDFLQRQQQRQARREEEVTALRQRLHEEEVSGARGMSAGSRRLLAGRPRAKAASGPQSATPVTSWHEAGSSSVKPLAEVLADLAPPPRAGAAASDAVQQRAGGQTSTATGQPKAGRGDAQSAARIREGRAADAVQQTLAGTWTYPGQGDTLYAAALQRRARIAEAQREAEEDAMKLANSKKHSSASGRLAALRLAREVCSGVADIVWGLLSASGHAGATWVLLQRKVWWHATLTLPELVSLCCALGFLASPWENILRSILQQEEMGPHAEGEDVAAAKARAGPAWEEAVMVRGMWRALVGPPPETAQGAGVAPGQWAVGRIEMGGQGEGAGITWCVRAGRVFSLLRTLAADTAAPSAKDLIAAGKRTGLLGRAEAEASWAQGLQGMEEEEAEAQTATLAALAELVFGFQQAQPYLPGGGQDESAAAKPPPLQPEEVGAGAKWPPALIARCRPMYSCRLAHMRTVKYKDDKRGLSVADHRTARGAAHGDRGTTAHSSVEGECSFAPLLCKRSMDMAQGGALPGGGRVPLHAAAAMTAAASTQHPQESHSYTLMAYGEAAERKAEEARAAAVAAEMQECSFAPNTAATQAYRRRMEAEHVAEAEAHLSAALAATGTPGKVKVDAAAAHALHLHRLHQKHEQRLERQRQAQAAARRAREEAELAQCTFTPSVAPPPRLVQAARTRQQTKATGKVGASTSTTYAELHPAGTTARPRGWQAHLARQARGRAVQAAQAEAEAAVAEGRVPSRAVVRDGAGRTVQRPFKLGRGDSQPGSPPREVLSHEGVDLPPLLSPAVLRSAVESVARQYQAGSAPRPRAPGAAPPHVPGATQPSTAGAASPAQRWTAPRPPQPPQEQIDEPPMPLSQASSRGASPAGPSSREGWGVEGGASDPPAVYVDVALGGGVTHRVPLWPHSDVAAVAAAFAAEHGLRASKAGKLQGILQAQLDAVLAGAP